jgi:four helix bundle protein
MIADWRQLLMTKSAEEFKARTKAFALRIVKLASTLPNQWIAQTIGKQIVRSGTSVGANYRAACRARSAAEFRSIMGIVLEEADETVYWLEILAESGLVKPASLSLLLPEANEITAMVVASIKTSRQRPD